MASPPTSPVVIVAWTSPKAKEKEALILVDALRRLTNDMLLDRDFFPPTHCEEVLRCMRKIYKKRWSNVS